METDIGSITESEIQIDKLLNEEKFEEAFHLLQHKAFRDDLNSIICDQKEKLDFEAIYNFCQFAIEHEQEDIYWKKLAFSVANYLSEKKIVFKQKALLHLLAAIDLDKADWKLKEEALLFYEGGYLPKKFVRPFAEIVIRMDPTNQKALGVLEKELYLI